MPELESMIEQKLIEQLVYGESQWTYREDLKTEADLWANFRYILEQNNKDRLNGEHLSDSEFEQVKNQLQFSSFYKAGEWLVGENGKVQVHVQRDTEKLHLVVMNHEHIAGGSSVYEVINQYSALKSDEEGKDLARDRRFDVTLMINGLPLIHIELKNKQHSYMDGFWQIKKYIGEGKFTGIFSAVQMFVVSNGVNTRYFAAANDMELNPKFMSGWVDRENNAVSDYLSFAKSVLRIPEAHEMIARYTVLDEDAKRLILLRPYQIHAIESIREASKKGQSGFVWHTTGSGKTLTSYKATRNLLMDIPAIDKAIFLIDRKDLDTQTTMAFQAYANNDLVDVGHYRNTIEEIKSEKPDEEGSESEDQQIDQDYELMAYSSTKIDYEYIINLIQNIVSPEEDQEEITPEERQKKLAEIKQYVEELRKENAKVAGLMSDLIEDIEEDDTKYRGKSITNILDNMKRDCVEKVVADFCITWHASKDDVMYAAIHYRNGEIPNESAIKATIDYSSYKETQEKPLPKFKYYSRLMAELRKTLDEEIKPLIIVA